MLSMQAHCSTWHCLHTRLPNGLLIWVLVKYPFSFLALHALLQNVSGSARPEHLLHNTALLTCMTWLSERCRSLCLACSPHASDSMASLRQHAGHLAMGMDARLQQALEERDERQRLSQLSATLLLCHFWRLSNEASEEQERTRRRIRR